MPPPDIGKPAVQLFYQVLDCDMLRELRAGGIAMLLHPKMRAEAFKHLNDPGDRRLLPCGSVSSG
jgi:hypothetical protein